MRKWTIAAGALATLLVTSPVHAVVYSTAQSEFTPGTLNQGFWATPSFGTSQDTNDNHYTGEGPQVVLRSFYTFDLSALGQTAASATLRVQRSGQSGDLALQFWDVSTPAAVVNYNEGPQNPAIFLDLGTGNTYGSFDVAAGPIDDYLSFSLNDQALADINAGSGFFTIGAAVSGPGYIFAFSGGDVAYLDIATSVPEPPTYTLMGLGLGFLGWLGRRRSLPSA